MTDPENPYSPPETELLPDQGKVEYPHAGEGKRFLNYLIDRLGIVGFTMAIGFALGVIQLLTHTDTTSLLDGGGFLFNLAFSYGASLLYYMIFEALTGASPGKWVTGTRAVMQDGSELTFKAAVLRSLCRLIPFEPFSFLGSRTGWHDSMTGTKVIDRRAEPVVSRRNPLSRPQPLPRQALWKRPAGSVTPTAPQVVVPSPALQSPPTAEQALTKAFEGLR